MNVDKKLVIGLTGFIKSGKTLAAKYFKNNGFFILNVDKFAHRLYKKGTLLYRKMVKIFGKEILRPDLTIDRKKMALRAFSSVSSYKKFCSLVYPELNQKLLAKINDIKRRIIILDMAVLFETGIYKKVDYIVLVLIKKKKWLNRINIYPNVEFIKKAFIYQNIFKLSKKIALSDDIIYNDGNKIDLYNMVRKLSKKIKDNLWKKKIKNKKNRMN